MNTHPKTPEQQIAELVRTMVEHHVDVVINEDNDWFNELIDKKLQERMEQNGPSTT
ncbi:hypothetical protein [uncultured Mediterranean phage uvMED]|nr:hypothetical protein [uncultured Mediterranean phage uvMED]